MNDFKDFKELNKDVLCIIGAYLSFEELLNFSKTCKYVKNNLYDNRFFWLNKKELESPMFKEKSSKELAKFYYFITKFNGDDGNNVKDNNDTNEDNNDENICNERKQNVLNTLCKDGDCELFKYFWFQKCDKPKLTMIASSYGHLEIIKFINSQLSQYISLFLFNTLGISKAIENSHIHLVKYFIKKKIDILDTIVYKACEYGNKAIVEILLENLERPYLETMKIKIEASKIAKNFGHEELSNFLIHDYSVIVWIIFIIFFVNFIIALKRQSHDSFHD